MERKKRILEKVPQYGKRKLVCGVGVFDAPYAKTKDEMTLKAYRHWNNMFHRCYGNSERKYKDCSVCEEWISFNNFRKWFDKNYVEGFSLDKDILFKHNKVYSSTTCVFVPAFINTLLVGCKAKRGELPIGVTKIGKGFVAAIWKRCKKVHIGYYKDVNSAFLAYKKEKELYIKEVAKEYYEKKLITTKVYDALMKYEVEITD